MSSYHVIAAVSQALRQLLWQGFSGDQAITDHVKGQQEINLGNPAEVETEQPSRLSLWLYMVSTNPYMRNDNQYAAAGEPFPRMPLTLHYLVTPKLADGVNNLTLLGKAMQILHDTPVALLQNADDRISEELRIFQSQLSLEELTRVWDSLKEPYRLSVPYCVQVAHITTDRTDSDAPLIRIAGIAADQLEAAC